MVHLLKKRRKISHQPTKRPTTRDYVSNANVATTVAIVYLGSLNIVLYHTGDMDVSAFSVLTPLYLVAVQLAASSTESYKMSKKYFES
jgi:hypothetical protein